MVLPFHITLLFLIVHGMCLILGVNEIACSLGCWVIKLLSCSPFLGFGGFLLFEFPLNSIDLKLFGHLYDVTFFGFGGLLLFEFPLPLILYYLGIYMMWFMSSVYVCALFKRFWINSLIEKAEEGSDSKFKIVKIQWNLFSSRFGP